MERDIRILISDRYLLVIMFLNFSIDLLISGLSLAALVNPNYFLFIAAGANLVTATVAAFQSGRDVWRERAIIQMEPYLLTLPISRRRFAFSRLISGMTRTTLTVLPGTLVIAYLYRFSIPYLLVGVFIVWIYSASVVGLSVVAASIARSLEVYTTIRSTAQVYLSFFSTQFYPPNIIPESIRLIANVNPMTWAVDAFRALGGVTGITAPITPYVDIFDIGALALLSATLLLLGHMAYIWSMPR